MTDFITAIRDWQVVNRLAWTLIHTLWLGAAIAGAFGVAMIVLRRRSANARYAAACLAMLAMLAAPAAMFLMVQPPQHAAVQNAPVPPAVTADAVLPPAMAPSPDGGSDLLAPAPARVSRSAVPAAIREAPPTLAVAEKPADSEAKAAPPQMQADRLPASAAWFSRTVEYVQPTLLWVVLAWAVGVVILSVWQLAGWLAAVRLKRLAYAPAQTKLADAVAHLAARLRVARPVCLLESALIRVPTVLGWLRPVILLPAGLAGGLSPQQVEAILAHEVAHIRRCDYLVNLVQSLVETLLFYHPAVWFISRRIRVERENCCDDIALAAGAERFSYADSLLHVARQGAVKRPRLSPVGPAVGAMGKAADLRGRIVRLLGAAEGDAGRRGRSWPVAVTFLAGLAIIGATIVASFAGGADAQTGAAKAATTQPATAPDSSEMRFDLPFLVGTTQPATSPSSAQDIARDDAVYQILAATRVSKADFEGRAFKDIIALLTDKYGLNVQVKWAALEKASISQVAIIKHGPGNNVTLERALRAALDDIEEGKTPLAYIVDDGVLTISTREDLTSLRYRATRVYDVRDLIVAAMAADESPRVYGRDRAFATTSDMKASDEDMSRDEAVKAIVNIIEDTIDPTSWTSKGGEIGYIRELGGQLIITQTLEHHRRIRELLNQLRAASTAPSGGSATRPSAADAQPAKAATPRDATKSPSRDSEATVVLGMSEEGQRSPVNMPSDSGWEMPSDAATPTPEDVKWSPKDYGIGPTDVVDVTIYGLTTKDVPETLRREVSNNGCIDLPFLSERIKADGLTEERLKDEVVRRYSAAKILKNPQVSVAVVARRQATFNILGGVSRTGVYNIMEPGMRMLNALSLAGGVTTPQLRYIYVIRTLPQAQVAGGAASAPATAPASRPAQYSTRTIAIDLAKLTKGDPTVNIVIRPKDVIFVPTPVNGEFYVTGEVNRPGVYTLTGRRITLKMGLTAADMGSPGGKWPERATLIRRTDDGKETYQTFSPRALFEGKAPDMYLKPDDLIVVGTANAAEPQGIRTTLDATRDESTTSSIVGGWYRATGQTSVVVVTPSSPAAGAAGPYIVSALVEVHPPDSAAVPAGSGQAYDRYRNTIAYLATDERVLTMAVDCPNVKATSWWRQDSNNALARLRSAIKVEQVGDTTLLRLSMTGTNPAEMTEIVNVWADAFVMDVRDNQNLDAKRQAERLEKEQEDLKRQLDIIKRDIANLRLPEAPDMQLKLTLNTNELQPLLKVREDQSQLRVQTTSELQAVEEKVKAGLADKLPGIEQALKDDSDLRGVTLQIGARERDAESLREKVGPEHKVYKDRLKDIDDLKKQKAEREKIVRDGALAQLRDAYKYQLDRVTEAQAATEECINRINKSTAQITKNLAEMETLKKRQQFLESAIDSFDKQLLDLRVKARGYSPVMVRQPAATQPVGG